MSRKDSEKLEDNILKYAIINAHQHKGKANKKAVLGKILSKNPALKKEIKSTMDLIEKIVEKVNTMSEKDISKKYETYEIKVKKTDDEPKLPALKDKGRKVVMRMAPYPSGPLHIGNSRMVILNDEYVKKYNGKLILVFDDTIGSKEKFVIPEGYNLIKDGLDWLGVSYDQIIYKTDRMELFYQYAEKMIKNNLAYVCLCTSEELRNNRKESKECIHRN